MRICTRLVFLPILYAHRASLSRAILRVCLASRLALRMALASDPGRGIFYSYICKFSNIFYINR